MAFKINLPERSTKPDDIELSGWVAQAHRNQHLLRGIIVNDATGESIELRQLNAGYLSELFKSGKLLNNEITN